MATILETANDVFKPARWGLSASVVADLGQRLHAFWLRYRDCFRTRTRDTSENAELYLRAQLTMDTQRNFANMERRVQGGDGQALQHFMSNSPWQAQAVFAQIQSDLKGYAALAQGSALLLDESPDEKAGTNTVGASRQHNGRQGTVDRCQVSTCLAYTNLSAGLWALVDGELFLPQEWFSPAFAARRAQLGIAKERMFATKPTLGLQMIQRVKKAGLPFDCVACDDLYGRNRALREALNSAQIAYAAQVPADQLVYLQPPRVGIPRQRHSIGRRRTCLQVLSRQQPREVRSLARSRETTWQRCVIRPTERGSLEADFAWWPVWTLTKAMVVRSEWLLIQRELSGRLTYTLLNGALDLPPRVLIERGCLRYFVERTFQDAKSELGWDELQAQTYRAWEHHLVCSPDQARLASDLCARSTTLAAI
jgi:SRSO17 transposase